MSTVDPISYTLIADDGLSSLASTQELRQALEKGSDDVKLETLRKIIVSTINGVPHVRTPSAFLFGAAVLLGGGLSGVGGRARKGLSRAGTGRFGLDERAAAASLPSRTSEARLPVLSAGTPATQNRRLTPLALCLCRPQPNLLMPIIQYVLPNRNKQIKKMLAFYWECVPPDALLCVLSLSVRAADQELAVPCARLHRVCPKLDDNGKLKQEMILVW